MNSAIDALLRMLAEEIVDEADQATIPAPVDAKAAEVQDSAA